MLFYPLNPMNSNPKYQRPSRTAPTAISLAILISASITARSEIVAAWETTGQSAWGVTPLALTVPSYGDSDATISGLTRGAGFATTNSAVANSWGGHGIEGPTSSADAITAGNVVTFTFAPNTGFEFSGSSIDLNYRRSGGGPASLAVQYQIEAGPFVDVGTYSLSSTSTAGASLAGGIDLSAITALQDVAGSTVTFRLVPFGATDPSGTFYIYGPLPGFDLKLNGNVQPVGSSTDNEAPKVASFFPLDGSSDITADGAEILTLVFNENIQIGTGTILVKDFATGTTVKSFVVETFTNINVVDNELGLVMSPLLAAGGSYYVEVPNTAVLDTAGTPNTFPGFNGTMGDASASTWNFALAAAGAAPSVVINKYLNSSPDRIELLVIGDQIAGSTVDMRGILIKDFSSNMVGDGGGGFVFSTASIWQAVPVGTLITLSNTASSPDTTSGPGDFVISVGLTDTVFFSPAAGAGTFDIATTDMVLIKAAGSAFAGTTGGIHALAGGVAGSNFTGFSGAKLRATGTSGTNLGVFATNPTGTSNPGTSRGDYIAGTAATGGAPLTLSSFGAPNNGDNASYISYLRGLVLGDGDGFATVVNVTPASPFNGKGLFDDGQTGQSAKVTINALISGVTLANLSITIPASLGTPGPVTLGGAGLGSGSASVSGQTVLITGASVTTTNPIDVTIDGLSTPVPTVITDNGNYTLTVATTTSAGSLSPIAGQPAARVVIPISHLRDVDGNGISLDSGAIVAVDGVCTEDNFSATNTQAYLQDPSGGITLFSSTLLTTPLTRGNRYAVVGPIQQFNGLTQIAPTTEGNIINLGASVEPAAQTVTVPVLLASAESLEGSLVKLENLIKVSGTWAVGNNVILKDLSNNQVTIRIQQTNAPATPEPAYPVTITGVLSQFDSANPFTSGYQVFPRGTADLAAGTLSDFDTWTLATGATGGMTGDTDLDGRDNAFEYAFGLSPTSGGSVNPFTSILNKTTGEFTFSRRKPSLTGLAYTYQYHTSLTGAWTAFTPAVTPVSNGGDPVEAVTVTVPAVLLTEPKLFIRIVTP